ncbi:hypothetical protein [Ensifer aridi]|uniref:hypothetical protein n=1 Tax=Ensifer aridi TaxID=1708715 RepID=UPI001FCD9AED|nr:hypothetical protein [Ensifer aridi]
MTLNELCLELAAVIVQRSNVGRLLHRLDFSHKKPCEPGKQQRPQIAPRRDLWIRRRRRFLTKALARLISIDETSTKRSGWAPEGQRYRVYPFGSPRLSLLRRWYVIGRVSPDASMKGIDQGYPQLSWRPQSAD